MSSEKIEMFFFLNHGGAEARRVLPEVSLRGQVPYSATDIRY